MKKIPDLTARNSNPMNLTIKTTAMNCKKHRNDLIGYLREELPEERMTEIRTHLDKCGECRSFAGYLSSTLDVIRIEREVEPDPFLATRLEGLLTPSGAAERASVRKPRLIPALAFTFFILAGVLGGWGLGNLLASDANAEKVAANQIRLMMDDLQQEPMETFIMGL
jgi:hypothetical protein